MRCECRSTCCCAVAPGPAAYAVARDGATIVVCTRCVGATDTILEILVDTVSARLEDYDPLGARVLRRRLQIRPKRRLA